VTVASLLQQLESDQAVLLMYLADELPAEDRAEVARRLAADAGLRAELERLRSAYESFAAAVQRDDRSGRLPVPESVAVRRVGREMRQWHARRLAAAARPAALAPMLRYPWWAYPVAAAASIVLAFLVWWGNTDRHVTGPDGSRVVIRSYSAPPADYSPDADPAIANYVSFELLAESLRLGEPVDPPSDWEDLGRIQLAVAPTDENVLMGLNEGEPADEGDASPEQDDISIQ
jgi:hypothetical protein